MIRIRSITSPALPIARDRIEQVKEIFRENFPKLAGYTDRIPDLLADPFRHDYQTVLMVSETSLGKATGFALLMHFPRIEISFLDFLAVRKERWGGGLGSALYEAVREYCQGLSSRGLYIEVQPDDPALTPEAAEFAQKRSSGYDHGRLDCLPVNRQVAVEHVGCAEQRPARSENETTISRCDAKGEAESGMVSASDSKWTDCGYGIDGPGIWRRRLVAEVETTTGWLQGHQRLGR